jgi:hypothetical protein
MNTYTFEGDFCHIIIRVACRDPHYPQYLLELFHQGRLCHSVIKPGFYYLDPPAQIRLDPVDLEGGLKWVVGFRLCNCSRQVGCESTKHDISTCIISWNYYILSLQLQHARDSISLVHFYGILERNFHLRTRSYRCYIVD